MQIESLIFHLSFCRAIVAVNFLVSNEMPLIYYRSISYQRKCGILCQKSKYNFSTRHTMYAGGQLVNNRTFISQQKTYVK